MNWDLYQKRLNVHGETQRERTINLAKHNILKNAVHSPDYKDMAVDGVHQRLMVSSTEADNKKRVKSMPYETIKLGALIVWNETHWLVNSVDFDDEIYQRGTIVQCNRIVRWQNPITLDIIERWCFCSKPYTSNISKGNIVSVPTGRYDIQLPYDDETVQVMIDKRLMLDVVNGEADTYSVVFSDRNTSKYQDTTGGFIEWTLERDQTVADKDNVELMICDYIDPGAHPEPPEPPVGDLLKCEISGRSDLRIGGSPRNYTAKFYDRDGVTEVKDSISPIWELTTQPGHEVFYNISLLNGNFVASVSAQANDKLIGDELTLKLIDNLNKYQGVEMKIEVTGF